jgi:uncharacterized membrane protein required for colicin V production
MQHTPGDLLAAVEFRWLDVLGLAIVLYFLVVGARRGMWWQIVRLLGIVATVAVARAAAPRIAPHFAEAFPDLSVRVAGGIVWTIVILLGLLVVAIIGRLGKDSLDAVQLGTIDRVGGALAGGLTGVLVHAAIVLCLCQVTAAEWSVTQVRGTTSQRLVDSVGRKLPLFLDAHARETLEPWLTPPTVSSR